MPRHNTCSCGQGAARGPASGAVDRRTRLGPLLQPHAAPHPLYGCPYSGFQCSLRHFKPQMSDREDNISTSRLKPCTSNAFTPTEAPPACSRFPLSPSLLHPRGLVPLFKESQVGQVSDTPPT